MAILFVYVCSFQSISFADEYNSGNEKLNYINYSGCSLDVDDYGSAEISAKCLANGGKAIHGKLLLQRKKWYGWSNVKTYDKVGYNGKLYIDDNFQLNQNGKYRLKFTVNCEDEVYTCFSNIITY